MDQVRAARIALSFATSTPLMGHGLSAEAVAGAARRQGIAAETQRGAEQAGWDELADILRPDVRDLTLRGMRLLATTKSLMADLGRAVWAAIAFNLTRTSE